MSERVKRISSSGHHCSSLRRETPKDWIYAHICTVSHAWSIKFKSEYHDVAFSAHIVRGESWLTYNWTTQSCRPGPSHRRRGSEALLSRIAILCGMCIVTDIQMHFKEIDSPMPFIFGPNFSSSLSYGPSVHPVLSC